MFEPAGWRRSLFAIGVVRLDPDVVAQVVHDGFRGTHLLHHVTGSDGTADLPCPLGEFFLDVMKLFVELSNRGADRFTVALMLFCVNVFRVLQRLVGFAIGVGIVRIVLIVVMQVQAQLVQRRFQAARQIIAPGEAAVLNLNWLLDDGNLDGLRRHDADDRRRCVKVRIVRRVVGTVMVMLRGMGHDKRPIAMPKMAPMMMLAVAVVMLSES